MRAHALRHGAPIAPVVMAMTKAKATANSTSTSATRRGHLRMGQAPTGSRGTQILSKRKNVVCATPKSGAAAASASASAAGAAATAPPFSSSSLP